MKWEWNLKNWLREKKQIDWNNRTHLFNVEWLPFAAEFFDVTIVRFSKEGNVIEKYNDDISQGAKHLVKIFRCGNPDSDLMSEKDRKKYQINHCYLVIKESSCARCGKHHKNGNICKKCEICLAPYINDEIHQCSAKKLVNNWSQATE